MHHNKKLEYAVYFCLNIKLCCIIDCFQLLVKHNKKLNCYNQRVKISETKVATILPAFFSVTYHILKNIM